MPLPITAFYASILILMLIGLTHYVIIARARAHVSVMHGSDMDLATKIRRHGNFTENVPMALIVMALAELGGGNATALHVAGVLLVAGRIIHPFGLHPEIATKPARIIGLLAGQGAMLICVVLIAQQLWA